MALAGLAAQSKAQAAGALVPRPPHFPPRVKRVIFLFMGGGPSHVDMFDYKPRLQQDSGKDMPGGIAGLQKSRGLGKLMGSPFSFSRYGQSGQWVSELLPHLSQHVDQLCFLKGMHTDGFDHGQASLRLHTGADNFVRPSIGSWISYGLGTENQSLPSFVTICPPTLYGGVRKHANAFLPAIHQGTPIGGATTPAREARIKNLVNERLPGSLQRAQVGLVQELNRDHQQRAPIGGQLEGLIQAFEIAFRMQTEAPRVLDFDSETPATRSLYGIDDPATEEVGRMCLMARQLSESGVRFVQVTHTIRKERPNIANWDQHDRLKDDLPLNCRAVDRPIAGLLKDLEARGLLEDTLVWWGGEFGRTPLVQSRGGAFSGRDHNPLGFTMWLAGGGVKPGFSYGETDDYGYRAVQGKVHMHDLHATILHLLGLDHERLTYPYAGRDFRLTDVHGRVVSEILTAAG